MLSIIIPHHKESIEVMHPLLVSLDSQIGVDMSSVEILIINDVKENTITNFSAYPHIEKIIKNILNEKGGGPGPSRQVGLDNCRGDYVIFCDADDSIISSLQLYELALTMKQNPGMDLYDYKFMEETSNGMFIPHDVNATWVFSKVYNKKFIDNNKIRFHPNLFYQEDSYFNQIFLAYQPKRFIMNQIMTIWRYNKNSITRNDNAEYTYSQFSTWLEALTLAERYIKTHLTTVNRREALLDILCSTYTQLQQFDPKRTEKYWGEIKEKIKNFIREFKLKDVLLNPTQQDTAIIQRRMQLRAFIPRIGFMDFYKPILEEIK